MKISVALSEDVVRQLDAVVETGESRSQVVERMLREAFAKLEREECDLRDLALINRDADQLNEEAEDALSYQVEV